MGAVIDSALESSAALIVICSPAAARSKWVDAEIRRFKAIHGEARIFPLIIDGMLHAEDPEVECFPEALTRGVDENGDLTDQKVEPLAANILEAGGRRDAFLRIAAALLGVGFDDLKQREQQRRQLQFALVTAGAVAIAAVTTILRRSAILSGNLKIAGPTSSRDGTR